MVNLDLNVILNMPAGPEMDALVAKEVMGYPVECEENHAAGGKATRVARARCAMSVVGGKTGE